MTITRHPDWQKLLVQFIAANERVRFQYGTTDCVMFGLDAIKSITGIDALPEIRGAYTSQKTFKRWLDNRGYVSIEDCVCRIAENWQLDEVPIEFMAPGDVALNRDKNGHTGLAISWQGRPVTRHRRGFIVPAHNVVRAWRIEFPAGELNG
jgi:hypothetical protein